MKWSPIVATAACAVWTCALSGCTAPVDPELDTACRGKCESATPQKAATCGPDAVDAPAGGEQGVVVAGLEPLDEELFSVVHRRSSTFDGAIPFEGTIHTAADKDVYYVPFETEAPVVGAQVMLEDGDSGDVEARVYLTCLDDVEPGSEVDIAGCHFSERQGYHCHGRWAACVQGIPIEHEYGGPGCTGGMEIDLELAAPGCTKGRLWIEVAAQEERAATDAGLCAAYGGSLELLVDEPTL